MQYERHDVDVTMRNFILPFDYTSTYEYQLFSFFFFKGYGAHRDLPFSPPRRSSDLVPRRRRPMSSTPMMASSTTTPSATASPPRVMVLMVQPTASTTITAASSASGMETNVTATLRRSRRNRNSTSEIGRAHV